LEDKNSFAIYNIITYTFNYKQYAFDSRIKKTILTQICIHSNAAVT